MPLTRRSFITSASLAAVAQRANVKIGVMDGILGKASEPASVAAAGRLGFDGLQVTLGRPTPEGRLVMADPERQAAFVVESKRLKLPLVATYIDALHANCLKNDSEALRYAAEGIEITRRINAKILMLVFFGKCALENRADMDAVTGPLRELAREAERANITLGFENTIRAEDDLRILDQVRSKSLQIYYDIGNATNLYNVDPAQEIRTLGRGRICQFHFKDRGYLGEGKVDVRSALDAIASIGWKGYIVLETSSPSKNIDADLTRNRSYLNGLL